MPGWSGGEERQAPLGWSGGEDRHAPGNIESARRMISIEGSPTSAMVIMDKTIGQRRKSKPESSGEGNFC